MAHPLFDDTTAKFDWPSSFSTVWLIYLISLVLLAISIRLPLSYHIPNSPLVVIAGGCICTAAAFAACTYCHVYIYDDFGERDSISFSGAHSETFRYAMSRRSVSTASGRRPKA
ncbi:MAG: hypothetical protein WDN06_14235 [Asticcacaulis sp.]